MKRASTFAVLAFLATMCATVPHARRVPRLDELTLDEKIGQLFVVGAHGVFMSESSPAYARLLHQVRDNHVGGFIWFVSNVYETAALTERLQAESRVPLLISADLESGIGMRFADTTFWPSPMAVAATGDPSLAEAEGRVAAMSLADHSNVVPPTMLRPRPSTTVNTVPSVDRCGTPSNPAGRSWMNAAIVGIG